MNFNLSALHLLPVVLCLALAIITFGMKPKIKPYKLIIAGVAIAALLISGEIFASLINTDSDVARTIAGLCCIILAAVWFFSAMFRPSVVPLIHQSCGTHDDETVY